MTIRITDNTPLDTPASDDEFVIIDKSDLTSSSDGTDKKITVRTLFNKAMVTHYNDSTLSKELGRWIGDFNDSIATLNNRTQSAATNRSGISRRATDADTQEMTANDATISPANLASLQATEDLMGLAKVAGLEDLRQGVSNELLATPFGLFQAILGTAVLGTTTQVFSVPFRNVQGDTLMHLKVQFFTIESDAVATSANPTNNYNHIHPNFDVVGTFPEPFSNQVLMVIPTGHDIEDDPNSIGSDFWCRNHTNTLADTTIRATRISGTSPVDPVQRIKIKCVAIGY